MRKLFPLLLLFSLVFFATDTFAQCCSPGNPVAGTAAAGTVAKKSFRSITFYRHSFSDTYFDGSEPAEMQGAEANFNFVGQIFAYGLTKRLTLETELGYFIDKTREDTILGKQQTHGMYNGSFSAKYGLLRSSNGFEFTLGAGVKFPFSQELIYDEWGMPLSEDMQPSTLAFGFIGQAFLAKSFVEHQFKIIWVNRYEVNGRSPEGYKFGDLWLSSLFFSKGLGKGFAGLLQFRNEIRGVDFNNETEFPHSGGYVLVVSPQLSYSLKKWNITLLYDYPVYRKLNGIQLSPKYAFGISVNRDFAF
jgi:hypothetical protein